MLPACLPDAHRLDLLSSLGTSPLHGQGSGCLRQGSGCLQQGPNQGAPLKQEHAGRDQSPHPQHAGWHAVCSACRQIQARLEPVRAQLAGTATFKEVVNAAYFQRVDLSAHGFYITPNVDGESPGCLNPEPRTLNCWTLPAPHACRQVA